MLSGLTYIICKSKHCNTTTQHVSKDSHHRGLHEKFDTDPVNIDSNRFRIVNRNKNDLIFCAHDHYLG